MSAKRTCALRAAVEGLERRDTPSSLAAAAATTTHATHIQGKGIASVILSLPGVNGQGVLTEIAGTAKGLGNFTGELGLYFNNSLTRARGNGIITAPTGDTVDLKLTATAETPDQVHPRPGVIKFTITGGTGAFASATGSGELVGGVNALGGYRFILHGRVRP